MKTKMENELKLEKINNNYVVWSVLDEDLDPVCLFSKENLAENYAKTLSILYKKEYSVSVEPIHTK